MIRRWALILILILVLVGGGLAHADGPAPASTPVPPEVVVTQTDEAKFPTIGVYFELRRPDGTFVLDAGRESVRVAEDGRDRPIVDFDAPVSIRKEPATIVLVLDQSGSMLQDDRIGALKRAVGTFVAAVPTGSEVAVIAFSSQVRLICPFTTDRNRVITAVNALEAEGATRYFDAVAAALALLAERPGRRAVLAMTDGKDTESRTSTLDGVIAAARRLNLPVHTLGLGDEIDEASLALRNLAGATRGQHYSAAHAGDLGRIYEEIARRLGSTYRLTFTTDRRLPDGTLRPIEVFFAQAKKAGQATVFIRGMVVPARGWSGLFLVLLGGLVGLAVLPSWLHRSGRMAPDQGRPDH